MTTPNTPASEHVCENCDDTHLMWLHDDSGDSRQVMCTRCPTPCQKCRAGGTGAFCEKTPCACACHKSASPPEQERCPDPFAAIVERLGGRRTGDARYSLMLDGAECARLISLARHLRDDRDTCADRLELEQRDHEVTKGYRQIAVSDLATTQAKLDALVAESGDECPEHGDDRIYAAWVEQYPNTEERRHGTSVDGNADDVFEAFEDGWIACWLASRAKAGR